MSQTYPGIVPDEWGAAVLAHVGFSSAELGLGIVPVASIVGTGEAAQ